MDILKAYKLRALWLLHVCQAVHTPDTNNSKSLENPATEINFS